LSINTFILLIWYHSLSPKTGISEVCCLKYPEIIFGTFLAEDYELDGNNTIKGYQVVLLKTRNMKVFLILLKRSGTKCLKK